MHEVTGPFLEADISIRPEWTVRQPDCKSRVDPRGPHEIVDHRRQRPELLALTIHLDRREACVLQSLCAREQPVEVIEAVVLEKYHDYVADPAQIRSSFERLRGARRRRAREAEQERGTESSGAVALPLLSSEASRSTMRPTPTAHNRAVRRVRGLASPGGSVRLS